MRRLLAQITLAALVLPLIVTGRPSTAQAAPPNILVIVTDDQRAKGTLARRVMPFTRKVFLERGTRFPAAFATTPLCCPSRASIFTGRYSHNHGVTSNGLDSPKRLDQESTVQFYLEQSGYRTGIFGKYLNRWDITLPPPYFHRWAITGASETSRNGYYDMTFNVQGTLRTIEQYSTDYIASKAVRFLRSSERDDSRPWFLYVATPAPHPPAIPAPKYRDARVTRFYPNPAVKESDRTDKPEYIRNASADMENVRRLRRRQLRTLMSVDDLVEQIFRELHENREGRRTLAVFTSDNGLAWGEHGWTGKRVPYTSSIGIPLSVRWPGRFPQGAVDIRIAANIDIGPTIFQAVGIEPELPVDGRSLLADWFRNRIHTEYWRSRLSAPPTWASTRGAQYQYIEYYDAEGNVRFREYYDLIRDPWQLTNLLGDADPGNDPSAEQLAELSAQLAADRSCSGQLCP